MLTIVGAPRRVCDAVSRREILRAVAQAFWDCRFRNCWRPKQWLARRDRLRQGQVRYLSFALRRPEPTRDVRHETRSAG